MNQTVIKQFGAFVEQNLKAIAALLAASALALVIIGVMHDLAATKEKEAAGLLFEVHAKADVLAKVDIAQAAAAYEPLLQKFPGTRAAYDANLQLGDLWMGKGNYTEASKAYSKAVEKAQDNFSKILALYNLGAAHENAGEYQNAVKDYDEAQTNKTAEFLRPELLMAEARCYEALKNITKATEIYKIIQDKYASKSFYSGAAAVFLSELSAKH